MGVYCSKRDVEFQTLENNTKQKSPQKLKQLLSVSGQDVLFLTPQSTHSSMNSKDLSASGTGNITQQSKYCFICHEKKEKNHSCTNAMIKDLEKHMDKDQLMDILLKLKQQVVKDDQVMIPYLHWGTDIVLIYNPFTCGIQRKQLSRKIPEFSRTVIAKGNRVFCVGGQDSDTKDALNDIFEIDIEEHFKVKQRCDLKQARFHHTSIVDYKNDYVITIGGMVCNPQGTDFQMLPHCEIYKVESDSSHEIQPLNVARDTCAACVFDSQWIYVFGGRISFKKRELTSVIERCLYTDTDVTEWDEISIYTGNNEFVPPLFNVGMCHQISEREILIFGGKNQENNQTNQAYIFDTNSFMFKTDKSRPKSFSSDEMSNGVMMKRDFRLPLEMEIPTSPYQVNNNIFVVGWSKQHAGIHLLRLSIMNLTWKDELNFLDYITVNM